MPCTFPPRKCADSAHPRQASARTTPTPRAAGQVTPRGGIGCVQTTSGPVGERLRTHGAPRRLWQLLRSSRACPRPRGGALRNTPSCRQERAGWEGGRQRGNDFLPVPFRACQWDGGWVKFRPVDPPTPSPHPPPPPPWSGPLRPPPQQPLPEDVGEDVWRSARPGAATRAGMARGDRAPASRARAHAWVRAAMRPRSLLFA
jgi:hypothetical protein